MKERILLKKSKTTLQKISNAPALSCVEYYFIPWAEKHFPLDSLYSATLIGYAQAEKIVKSSGYTRAENVPRIQTLAETAGLCTHKKIKYTGNEKIKQDLLLVKVSPDFFQGNIRPWRNDHYIQIIGRTKTEIFAVNEYPQEIRRLALDEHWHANEALIFSFLEHNKINLPCNFSLSPIDENQPSIIQFRDTLMLYRIILQRAQCVIKDNRLRQFHNAVNQIFFYSALLARRGVEDKFFIADQRKKLISYETNIYNQIMEKSNDRYSSRD